MRRRGTLIVLALFAALVLALVLSDRTRSSTDQKRDAQSRLFPGFDRAHLAAFTITRQGKSVTLEREGQAWWIASPRCRAETTAVDEVLGELDFGQAERRILHPDRALREKLGLASPRFTLLAGGYTFAVGGDAPDGNTVYVARSGDPDVLVVERRLVDVLDRSPEAWRSLRLTLTEPDQSRSFAIGTFALERQGAGWALTRPLAARAAPDRVDALFSAIDRARALSAAPGTRASGREIVVDGVQQARIGGPCAHHPDQIEVARADGLILCFAAKDLAPLQIDASALRERRLFPLSLDEVQGFDVIHRERKLELRRAEGMWRIVAPLDAAGPADDGAVRAWLGELLALSATGHGPPGRSIATIRLITTGDQISVDLAAPQDGTLRALRRGESDALLFSTPPADLLDPSPLRFRDRRVSTFRADDLSALTVEEGSRSVAVERVRRAPAPDRWQARSGVPVDDQAVARLVETLADLRADRFQPDTQLAPARRLRFTVSGAARELELAQSRDGCLGRLAGVPAFHLPAQACAALLSPVIRKSGKSASAPP